MNGQIEFKNLSMRFGEKHVFENFSETVSLDSNTAIMGESGKGKTTLINLLLGFYTPTEGEITGIPGKISAVFQSNALFEDFNALSNVKAIVGKNYSKAELTDIFALVGLSPNDVSIPVRKLSGGMKRRVAVVRAVLAESDLIILDEPFTGLDSETKKAVADFIMNDKFLKSRPIVLITHDAGDASLLNVKKIIKI